MKLNKYIYKLAYYCKPFIRIYNNHLLWFCMWQDHFLWCLLSEVHQCQHGWEICHNVTLHTEGDGQRLRDHDLRLPGSFSHWSKHLGLEHWLHPPHNLLCCCIQVHGWVKVLNSLKTLPITLLRQCLWKLTSVVDFCYTCRCFLSQLGLESVSSDSYWHHGPICNGLRWPARSSGVRTSSHVGWEKDPREESNAWYHAHCGVFHCHSSGGTLQPFILTIANAYKMVLL